MMLTTLATATRRKTAVAWVLAAIMAVIFSLYHGVMTDANSARVVEESPEARGRGVVEESPEVKQKRILPISFGLPEGRFERSKRFRQLNKTRDFALVVPGLKSTYIYRTEESYYDGYATALYGITMRKEGWDCLRHYEIIASGSMPYFLDLDQLPSNTMHDFPVHIVLAAMQLPGVPTPDQVQQVIATNNSSSVTDHLQIDHSLFNRTLYDDLMTKLVEYSLQHLTWSGKARYVLSMAQQAYPCWATEQQPPRVLFVTHHTCEYMSCTLWGGMYDELGGAIAMSSFFGPKVELFRSLRPLLATSSYGRGFSYSDVFDTWNGTNGYSPKPFEAEIDPDLQERLDTGFFNMIVLTNAGNKYCTLHEYFRDRPAAQRSVLSNYQQKFNPLVVVVDGSDILGCHVFPHDEKYGLHYHFHFIREYNAARERDQQLPHGWSGCNSDHANRTFHKDS